MDQPTFQEMYERWLVGPLFRPWAELTLTELEVAPGDRVLDVACGTGIVARVARERLGATRVVGVDVSPDMLAVARAATPDVDWREGDAAVLPLGDGEAFDVVVCQQGLQFFPDKPKAVSEMRRAMASGGRLAVTTWRPDAEIPMMHALRQVAERRLGPISDRRHGFGEAAPLEALLRDAGFANVRSRTVTRTVRFPDAAPFLRLNAVALVGLSSTGNAMTGEDRRRVVEAIVSESAPVAASYAEGAGLAFALSSNLATAEAG